MAINVSKCLCDIQNIPQIHWVILYDDLWEIEKIAKFDHFWYICTIWAKWGKCTKNDQNLRFFQSPTNHNTLSPNVFGVGFGCQRGIWKHL